MLWRAAEGPSESVRKPGLACRRDRLQPGILLESGCRPKGRRYGKRVNARFSHRLFSPRAKRPKSEMTYLEGLGTAGLKSV
jgi:hypothetical protein